MPREQRLVEAAIFHGVEAVLGFDLEDRTSREVAEMHTALDFRLHNAAVNEIAQMRARPKHAPPIE